MSDIVHHTIQHFNDIKLNSLIGNINTIFDNHTKRNGVVLIIACSRVFPSSFQTIFANHVMPEGGAQKFKKIHTKKSPNAHLHLKSKVDNILTKNAPGYKSKN